MRTFDVPTPEQLDPAARAILEDMRRELGRVLNLYAFIGHSANALRSYLAFQQAQAHGTFNAREREAVFLAVSEVNGCRYCQAAHTALAKLNGFSEEETRQLRAGSHADARLGAITALAGEIARTAGHVSSGALERFYAVGYDDGALVDLVALVADKTLANYLHNITELPIDFPAARPLERIAA